MASDDKAPKAKHRITLTRAALYLLEGCLQLPGPIGGANQKIVQWNKVWDKVRSANNRLVKLPTGESIDIEKGITKKEGETDLSWAVRQQVWNASFKAWEDEVVTVTMNDKMRDTCRTTMEWVSSHHDDPKSGIKLAGKHAASLLVGLGLAKPEEDGDYEMGVEGDAPVAAAAS